MKKWFEKNETLFAIATIVIYVISNSYFKSNFGFTDYRSLIGNAVLTMVFLAFIFATKLGEYYGLTKLPKAKELLFFVPLFIMASTNLWGGISINNTVPQLIVGMSNMCLIGFLEEIIFRGFLFKMMAKDKLKPAIIVSSLTFGIGHIINLLTGAAILETLIQIAYAVSIGYLFVIIMHKTKSLWPCIITHSAIDMLSLISVEAIGTLYIAPIALIIIPLAYAFYINKKVEAK